LSAVEKGVSPLVGGEDGRNTIELIASIYKAGAEQRTVDLPLSKNDAFYTVKGMRERVPRFYQKTASLEEMSGNITYSRYNR
jgi:hypothetical protein